MPRAEFSKKTKREALKRAGYRCEATGPAFGFQPGQRCNCSLSLGVQFDHVIPDALQGLNDLDNCEALCIACHKVKTKADVKRIRKSDRQRDRDTGVVRPKGSIKSAGFPKTARQPKASRHDWAPKLRSKLYVEKETI
jgi:5-methylcytosine-specific restriction endonuclease McrA